MMINRSIVDLRKSSFQRTPQKKRGNFSLFNLIKKIIYDPDIRWISGLISVPLYFGCLASGLMIGKAIFHWSGNPKDVLLLKIFEEKIDKNEDKF